MTTRTRRGVTLGVVFAAMILALPAAALAGPGHVPRAGEIELGIFGGALFPPSEHELYEFEKPSDTILKHQPFNKVAVDVGIRASYLFLPFLGVELELAIMPTKTRVKGDAATIYRVGGHLIAQYPGRITPFVLIGSSALGVSSDALGSDVDYAFHWGGGAKFYVTEWLDLRLDLRHDVSGKRFDGGRASYLEVLGGLSVVLGRKVPRKPAPTPPPEPVGPADSDGDGVPDSTDKCPNTPAKTADGCPDGDGDGIPDAADQCPKAPGKAPSGCPDTDGDGVLDKDDKCPKAPGKAPSGCPDTDGDGVLDKDDKCVDEPETKNGYLDTDGCPDELPKAAKKFTGAIKGINFVSGKATLRKSSFRTLDKAVAVLKKFPSIRLLIRGHTDDRGKRSFNLELSRKRADAVRDYLVGKGIAADRLRSEGLGPDEPVASNKSRAGRAKNRRVEFKIITD